MVSYNSLKHFSSSSFFFFFLHKNGKCLMWLNQKEKKIKKMLTHPRTIKSNFKRMVFVQ